MKYEDLGVKRFSRNPMICDIFQRMNVVERVGSGIKRIRDLVKQKGLKEPKIEVSEGFFTLTFFRDVKDGVKDGLILSLNSKKIILEIEKKSDITAEELSKIRGISKRNIEKNIKKLKEEGLIERVGSDKGGYWRVL